jgi:hypothetical protein
MGPRREGGRALRTELRLLRVLFAALGAERHG